MRSAKKDEETIQDYSHVSGHVVVVFREILVMSSPGDGGYQAGAEEAAPEH